MTVLRVVLFGVALMLGGVALTYFLEDRHREKKAKALYRRVHEQTDFLSIGRLGQRRQRRNLGRIQGDDP